MIYLTESPRSLKSIDAVSLAAKGFVALEVNVHDKLFRLVVSMMTENSIRVIYVDAFFVFCNYSSHSLKFWPFCLPSNEKFEFRAIRAACYEQEELKAMPENTKDASNP